MDKKLIAITDSKLMTYLNYRGIKAVDSKRIENKVTLYYEDTEEFQDAKLSFPVDKNFHNIISAKYSTEEILRATP